MPRPISHEEAERDLLRLVFAVSVREFTDDEVEQFASLIGKFVLLSTSHPGAAAVLERDDVRHAIWEVGLQLSGA